jgi:lysophospholipase L1-like esterase
MTDINDVYRGVERERGIALISMYELFKERCEEVGLTVDDLLPDGLHPGDEGYRVMLSLMCEALGI